MTNPSPLSLHRTALVLLAVACGLIARPAAAQSYECAAPPLGTNCAALLPDNSTASSTITVLPGACDAQATIVATAVHLKVSHQWVGDLSATLVHPDGTRTTLLLRPGIADGNVYGCSNEDLDVVFTDGAGAQPGAQCNDTFPAISGAVLPLNPLSSLNGKGRNGTWTLQVNDGAGFGIGAIDAWSLDLPCTLPAVNVVATQPTAVVGTQPGQLTFARGGPSTGPLVVSYALSGTAAPSAYDPLPGSVTIADGADSATVDVVPTSTGISYDTTVTATLVGNAVYAVGAPASATVTIRGSNCGNGIVDTGETCDDGLANGAPGDSCARNCKAATGDADGGTSGSNGTSGGTSSSGSSGAPSADDDDGGCSCGVAGAPAPGGAIALALATVALARGRTRRKPKSQRRAGGDQ